MLRECVVIASADGFGKYSREGRFEVESDRHDYCCRVDVYAATNGRV